MSDYKPFRDDTPSLRLLVKAYREGVVSRGALLAAVQEQRGPAQWRDWARFWLLVYGVTLVLAGVMFFFAWNWADMHRFEKLALVEIALAACVIFSWRNGWRTPLGEASLVAAAVLTGVLMAVFGQVYQTGADAYELFRGWALLVLPWVLIAESAALWLLFLVVADIAIMLYAAQVLPSRYSLNAVAVAGLLPAVLLACRELLRLRGIVWLPQIWLRPVLLTGSLVMLSIPVAALIFDDTGSTANAAFGLLAWLMVAGGAYWLFREFLPDMLSLTLVVIDVAVLLLCLLGEWVFSMPGPDEGVFMIFSMLILAVVGGAYQWLRFEASVIHARVNKEPAHAEA